MRAARCAFLNFLQTERAGRSRRFFFLFLLSNLIAKILRLVHRPYEQEYDEGNNKEVYARADKCAKVDFGAKQTSEERMRNVQILPKQQDMLNGCGFSVFDSPEMQNGHSCELNAPETSSLPVSEATYTVNVTDPTPEPNDENPFGEPQRFPTPKRRGNNEITKRRSKTEEGQAQMP